MVVTTEKNIGNIDCKNQDFYDYLDSPEVLLNDWKLIQEAEKSYDPNNCMSAKEAYLKGLEYINNLK